MPQNSMTSFMDGPFVTPVRIPCNNIPEYIPSRLGHIYTTMILEYTSLDLNRLGLSCFTLLFVHLRGQLAIQVGSRDPDEQSGRMSNQREEYICRDLKRSYWP